MNKFYSEAFEGYEVPENIKVASIEICKQYNINGISDPMYISNVIANELKIGDGMGNFNDNKPNTNNINELYERFAYSYSTCIKNSGEDANGILTILNKYFH